MIIVELHLMFKFCLHETLPYQIYLRVKLVTLGYGFYLLCLTIFVKAHLFVFCFIKLVLQICIDWSL